MFRAKLASVNANRRNVAIFHHVTFATAGLLHALFEIVYDPQHNVCTTTCTRTHTRTRAHTNTRTYTHVRTHTHIRTHTHTYTHTVVSTPIEDSHAHTHIHTHTHGCKHPNRGLLYLTNKTRIAQDVRIRHTHTHTHNL